VCVGLYDGFCCLWKDIEMQWGLIFLRFLKENKKNIYFLMVCIYQKRDKRDCNKYPDKFLLSTAHKL
jgi:hypothetical protein